VSSYGRLRHQSRWLNGVSIELSETARKQVEGLSFVSSTRPVAIAKAMSIGPAVDINGTPLGVTLETLPEAQILDTQPPHTNRQRDSQEAYGPSLGQLTEINVPAVHAMGYSGSRVRFMMIDTGFRTDHIAFSETDLIGQYDFAFDDEVVQNEPEDFYTQHNHGTGCWGTAGGYAPGRLIGPAYGASFALAKTEVVDSETQAEEDNYVAALEWADSLGVAITSASLNYICFDDESCYGPEELNGDTAVITRAVDIAAGRGILCVNSQGNYGCPDPISLGTPSDADSIIAVGAVDSLNIIASWSSCGPTYDGRTKPEVVARGKKTVWASASEWYTFGTANGTSLATPLVSGAAALVIEAHPEWSNMQVRDALMSTADRAIMPDDLYGWGRINTAAAIAAEPVVYPEPFSLIQPPDNIYTDSSLQEFSWRASTDPDHGDQLEYTLWISEVDNPASMLNFDVGIDTTFVIPVVLSDDTAYVWEVSTIDTDGHRRYCRKAHRLFITGVQNSLDDSPALTVLPQPRINCSPNPFRSHLRFSVDMGLGLGDNTSSLRWNIFDPIGRRIAAGHSSGQAGLFEAEWDGRTSGGKRINPGIYYLEVSAKNRFARETIVFLGR